MDKGKLVLQEELTALRQPTGRVFVESPDVADIVSQLDGQVVSREGSRLLIRHADPAALNTLLVGKGMRINEISTERRTLEQVVLDVTTESADHISGPVESGPA